MLKAMGYCMVAIFGLVTGISIVIYTLHILGLPAQNTILLLSLGAGFLVAAAVAFIAALDASAKAQTTERQVVRYQQTDPVEVIHEECHIDANGAAHWRRSSLRGAAKELAALVGTSSATPHLQIQELTRPALPAPRGTRSRSRRRRS